MIIHPKMRYFSETIMDFICFIRTRSVHSSFLEHFQDVTSIMKESVRIVPLHVQLIQNTQTLTDFSFTSSHQRKNWFFVHLLTFLWFWNCFVWRYPNITYIDSIPGGLKSSVQKTPELATDYLDYFCGMCSYLYTRYCFWKQWCYFKMMKWKKLTTKQNNNKLKSRCGLRLFVSKLYFYSYSNCSTSWGIEASAGGWNGKMSG